MSKSSEQDRKVKVYLLNIMADMNDDGPMNINESIKYCVDRFTSEYQWRVNQVGPQTAMTDWLQGLATDIAYWNHEILELAVEWGSLPRDATEKQEDAILGNYWRFMAVKLLQLFNGYQVPKSLEI